MSLFFYKDSLWKPHSQLDLSNKRDLKFRQIIVIDLKRHKILKRNNLEAVSCLT